MKKNGAVLMLTLIIMSTVTVITVAFIDQVFIKTKRSGNNLNSSKAFWIAEAGIQKSIYELKISNIFRENPTTVSGNFAGGTYSVSIVKNNDQYTLTSVGVLNNIDRTITQTVVILNNNYPDGIPDAFNYSIYVRGNLQLGNTTGSSIQGNLMSGGSINVGNGWAINGNIQSNAQIDFPYADFNAYEDFISENYGASHVINGNFTFADNQTYTGLYYVNGNVDFGRNVTLNGGVVSEGTVNLRHSDNLTINSNPNEPAIISEGNINISDAQNVNLTGNGLIYTEQGISLQRAEDSTFVGVFIVYQTMNVANIDGVSIIFNPAIPQNPPRYFPGWVDNSVIVNNERNWQEI